MPEEPTLKSPVIVAIFNGKKSSSGLGLAAISATVTCLNSICAAITAKVLPASKPLPNPIFTGACDQTMSTCGTAASGQTICCAAKSECKSDDKGIPTGCIQQNGDVPDGFKTCDSGLVCPVTKNCSKDGQTCEEAFCKKEGTSYCATTDSDNKCCTANQQCKTENNKTACQEIGDEKSRCIKPQNACTAPGFTAMDKAPGNSCCNPGTTCSINGLQAGCCPPWNFVQGW